MGKLAFAAGLLVFWAPPIVALAGGRAGNAILLLTPVALAATFAWARACKTLLPPSRAAKASMGVKVAAVTTAAMIVFWTAIGISVDQNLKAVFVIFILWSITIALSPLGVWWYNRISKVIPKADQPDQSMADWLDELPRDE